MKFAIPDSDSDDEFIVQDVPVPIAPFRRNRQRHRTNKYPPSDSESDTPSDHASSSQSTSSSSDEEIDYDFGYLSPAKKTKKRREWITHQKGVLYEDPDEWAEWDRTQRREIAIRTKRDTILMKQQCMKSPKKPLLTNERLEKETAEIQSILDSLKLSQEQEEQRARDEFQARSREFWRGIDRTIATVQAEERKLADEQRKAEVLKQQMEEEKRRQAAEDEERKKKEEWTRLEEERKKAELKAQEDREKAELRKQEEEAKAKELAEREERPKASTTPTKPPPAAATVPAAVAVAPAAPVARATPTTGLFSLQKNEQRFSKWVEHQRRTKAEIIEPAKADSALMKSLRSAKGKIKRRIGQLSNDKKNIVEITRDIHIELCSKDVLDRPVSATNPVAFSRDLPIAYLYLLSHISKSLLQQARDVVVAQSDTAFPLAKFVIGLFISGHAALGEILVARFVKKCPWVLPLYPSKAQGQSQEDYDRSLGYLADENTVQYSERMGAIVTLYLAICATDVRPIVSSISPQPQTPQQLDALIQVNFRRNILWSWIAGLCKDPLPPLLATPLIMVAALDTMGQALLDEHGSKQVRKVVLTIMQQGLGPEGANGGLLASEGYAAPARHRLRVICEDFMNKSEFDDNPAKVWSM